MNLPLGNAKLWLEFIALALTLTFIFVVFATLITRRPTQAEFVVPPQTKDVDMCQYCGLHKSGEPYCQGCGAPQKPGRYISRREENCLEWDELRGDGDVLVRVCSRYKTDQVLENIKGVPYGGFPETGTAHNRNNLTLPHPSLSHKVIR